MWGSLSGYGMKKIDAGGGEIATILQPGHTPGQISAIVPVSMNGKPEKLLSWSGNDNLEEARQYAISTDFVRGVAEQEEATAFINTHPYQGAMFYYLRRMHDAPAAENPFVTGKAGVSRLLGLFGECQRAAAQRFEVGIWASWE